MILLDTNVLSELMRPQGNEIVLKWVDSQEKSALGICVITVAEILYGIAKLPEGKRKTNLLDTANHMFTTLFSDRILPFDYSAAQHYAKIMESRERAGKPISMGDAQIAAVCKAAVRVNTSPVLVTRNVKDFTDLDLLLINPWQV
jgi:toxin FitB